MNRVASLCLVVVIASCGGGGGQDTPPVPERPDCNPIVGNDCLSGVPSMFYMRADASTATGWRLDLPAEVMPENNSGTGVDPSGWNLRDGSSPVSPIHVLLSARVDPGSLVTETDPLASLEPQTASTLLVDVATGVPVAHFAEVDLNAPDGDPRQALILRPWAPLSENHRYAVALTRKLRDEDGEGFMPTATMERLLDGKLTGYERIDSAIEDWRAAISAVTGLGLGDGDLLAVWPMHTASRGWTSGVARALRADLLAAIDEGLVSISVDRIEVDADHLAAFPNLPDPADDDRVQVKAMHPDVALRLRGTFEIPLYLTEAGAEGTLNWQAGQVARNGSVQRPFVLLVPPTVVADGGGARLLLYGHGLLRGACVEGCVEPGDAELMPHLAHALHAVMIATDWWGLSQADLVTALGVSQDFSKLPELGDKLAVAAVAPIALTRAAQADLLTDPLFFTGPDAASAAPLTDAAQPPVYYGNSLGGILGTCMTSLHPDLDRMVMNVPGAVWSTLLLRSVDFSAFSELVANSYADAYHRNLLVGMSQTFWDLADPAHFAGGFIREPVEGTRPERRALWTASLGDCQVPNLGTGTLARAAGASLVGPVPDDAPWIGVDRITNPHPGDTPPRAMVVHWNTLRGTLPPGNLTPADDNGAHYATRFMPEFQQMVWRFLMGDGTVDSRYCLASGRDTDGALPCDLEQIVPATEEELPPLPEIPPPALD